MRRTTIDLKKLYQLYVIEKKTVVECGELLKKSKSAVQHQVQKNGWSRSRNDRLRDEYGRYIREGQELPPQELYNNPSFKSGKEIYRKIARIYRIPEFCYHCKRTQNLHIHHKDENRENNDPSNLMWVCGSCHMTCEHKDRLERRDEKGRFC